jgi:hypothetical protein
MRGLDSEAANEAVCEAYEPFFNVDALVAALVNDGATPTQNHVFALNQNWVLFKLALETLNRGATHTRSTRRQSILLTRSGRPMCDPLFRGRPPCSRTMPMHSPESAM